MPVDGAKGETVRIRTWESGKAVGIVTLLALLVAGCGGMTWRGALRKNSVGAYHRFLRDNPDSRRAKDAEERIAYLRAKVNLTLEGFQAFNETYPESRLLPQLREHVEPLYFSAARSANTPAAYQDFLDRYPGGAMTDRVKGNLAYVGSVRVHPTLDNLRWFVANYPDSDFFSEAQSTLELLGQRYSTAIQTLAVRVDVAPNVGQPRRVRHGFAALVARHYQELGVSVVLIGPGQGPPPNADAWMRIDYHEAPAEGTFGGRTLVSQCRVRIYHTQGGEPFWDRTFEAPADHIIQGAYGRDKTVFANSTYRFWEEFFVPISTWTTSKVRKVRSDYLEEVSAIDVRGDRGVMLYRRGGMDFLDISTPLELKVIDRYRRERDLTRWKGVKLLSDTTAISFGPDGVELIEFEETQPRRLAQWEMPEVGSVNSADLYGSTLLFAGTKGVFAVRLNNRPLRPHRLLEGEFVGLYVRPPRIYLVRPDRVEVTTPKLLLQHLSGASVSLGRGFGAHKVRVVGDSLYVMGKDELVQVGLPATARPVVISRLPVSKIGIISDLVADPEHLYLLGSRGLEVTGPNGERIADTIQVEADHALARTGRFLFLVGNRSLEVLDMGPYQAAPASPVPHS